MIRYTKKRNEGTRAGFNERADCSVMATAIAARMPYEEAHTLLATAGRRKGKRFTTSLVLPHLEAKGYKVEAVENLKQKNGSAYTPKTIGNRLKRGYYMVWIKGHVFAVVNGVVEDWTQGRQHRITRAVKITKPRAS